VAGTLVVEKVVGAAAERGADLKTLKALGDRVNKATRSMGVALTSCTVPAAGKPTFDIGPADMEMGVGIHGEPGRRRVPLQSADAIAEEMVAAIAGDLGGKGNALLFVNGFGGTPSMELYLMYEAAQKQLTRHGITPVRALVGSYVTSLDMAGCSITVTMFDDEIAQHWDAPVHTAALRWGL
jgi:dihydroxyacetone kinase-like protein